MRSSARAAAAGALALVALGGIVVIVVRAVRDRGATDAAVATVPAGLFGSPRRAAAPFETFGEARVALDGRCLRVLVASSPAQRGRGLRGVRDLGPYDGMVFVYGSDVSTRFTMARTPLPLDIGWYSAEGAPVDRTTMAPCPEGTDATCPVYEAARRYRYALETEAGSLGAGSLAPCS